MEGAAPCLKVSTRKLLRPSVPIGQAVFYLSRQSSEKAKGRLDNRRLKTDNYVIIRRGRDSYEKIQLRAKHL
jgi:hypothetical protein